MQTSAMKACFHIAECSFSYAKISYDSQTDMLSVNFVPYF